MFQQWTHSTTWSCYKLCHLLSHYFLPKGCRPKFPTKILGYCPNLPDHLEYCDATLNISTDITSLAMCSTHRISSNGFPAIHHLIHTRWQEPSPPVRLADKQLRTIVRQINISRCDGWLSVPRVLVVLNPVLERLRAGVVCPQGWSVGPQGRDLCPRGALRSVEFAMAGYDQQQWEGSGNAHKWSLGTHSRSWTLNNHLLIRPTLQ